VGGHAQGDDQEQGSQPDGQRKRYPEKGIHRSYYPPYRTQPRKT
jgi:hypothetical protein